MKCAMPIRYCICVEVKRTYVNTALDVRLDPAFTQSSWGHALNQRNFRNHRQGGTNLTCSRGLFKVVEGAAGVVLDVIRVRARGSKRGAKMDRLHGALGGCDLNDERDHDLNET